MIEIRVMSERDVALGLRLCRAAEWNQLEADWRRLLALQPDGCFVAEWKSKAVGTATTTVYGRTCAWIGMVLVDLAHRRRGIGTALLEHCIAYLQARGVRAIKLDATEAGRAVYAKVGFVDEYATFRYVASPPTPGAKPLIAGVRRLHDADWPAIARLDAEAFGADRSALLRRLAADNRDYAQVAVEYGDDVKGFAMAYPGHDALHVGPVVAVGTEEAQALVGTLIGVDALRGDARQAVLDVLGPNAASVDVAATWGFTRQRRLMRMVLGENASPGRTELVFAGSGFETG